MGARAVHQFTSFARRGDAVYDHAEQLRKIFLSWGLRSDIYLLDPEPSAYEGVFYHKKYRPSPDDIILYHFGIGGKLTDIVLRQPGRKFLVYHNMTPEKYLLGVDNQSYLHVRKGRKELDRMKGALDGVFAVSDYNARDLKEKNGYTDVTILPIVKDFSEFEGKTPSPGRVEKWKSDKKTIFFIGRIVPNKRHGDLIKTLYAYTKLYGRDARLVMPGSWKNTESYRDYLSNLAEKLGVGDLLEMPGFIDDEDFHVLFGMADVYLSLSEHEGFGVPLLEAMWFGAPVVAYSACAIPEILGPAGIKLKKKDSFVTATVLRELFENAEMRQRIIAAQKERLKEFSADKSEKILKEALVPYL